MNLSLQEKLRFQKQAGIITESQYRQKLAENDKLKLSNKEQEIVDDLLSTLNEGAFDTLLDKLKSYAKQGMLTLGIISAVLNSPNLSAAQKSTIKDEPYIDAAIKTRPSPEDNAKRELAYQYDWWVSYLQSPQYLQRLQKEFPNKDKKWVENERDIRLKNLRNVKNKTHFVKAIGSQPGIAYGVYIPKEYEGQKYDVNTGKWVKSEYTKDSKGYDKKGNIYFEKDWDYGYETIPAHELGHAVDDAGARIPDSTKEKIYQYTKGGDPEYKVYKSGNKEYDYYTTPTEFINRLQPVRYLLQKLNIYDARKSDFTEKDYNKMMNSKEIKDNEHFKDIMNSLKGNEQQKKKNFIDLMNTIASNNINQQDISNIA
jgi:hypothetical protein